ncbi:hypothetical protein KEM56_000491 [Ascosphaera pollenicola]|nr:hypothetical protein KEM56_000491 [Ascosphaera pollenicola]
MLSRLLTYAFWLCALCASLVRAQEEDNFDDDPSFKKIFSRAYTLTPPFLDSEMGNRWFDFGGDTVVRTDRYIRLTGDRPSQKGWLFSRVPLAATNFQIEFEFQIHGNGHLHGDGLAMWLTKERANVGPVFGSQDMFEGLGIFIDTYKNGRPSTTFPYVMAMIGDGKTPYDQSNDGKANEIGGCPARGIRGTSNPVKGRLTYFQDKYLALDLLYKPDGSWTRCFRVDHDEAQPIRIPSVAYLGFTAETGELSDNHDLLNVQTYSIYQAPPSDYNPAGAAADRKNARQFKKPNRVDTGANAKEGSWWWTMFKLLLIGGVVVGGYAAFAAIRTSRLGNNRW